MVFPKLGNSDHVVVPVSIEFPSNSLGRDTPFYSSVHDYFHAEWDELSGSWLKSMYISLIINISLSYATFKMRKFGSLFNKINTFLQKNYYLLWIASRANILSKYIVYIFFNFRRDFCGSFPLLFPKAPASCCKNI